jgi:hypothetical protein
LLFIKITKIVIVMNNNNFLRVIAGFSWYWF